jgi:omega-6 fatty acid desaturase (delta-12 desaturase)
MAGNGTEALNTAAPARGAAHSFPAWHAQMAEFRTIRHSRSIWQLVNTLIPYLGLWYLMIRTRQLGYPYVLTLALAVIAAAFLVRLFILFHDSVHGSLFRSMRANTFIGHVLGVLVFTPFEDWRFSHLRHHGSYANLDARGFGDIWTLTREEYEHSGRGLRCFYRLYRSPAVLIGLGALFSFLLRYRLPTRKSSYPEWTSVLFTNLLILGVAVVAARFIGWETYLLIQVPVVWLAGAAGVWLFYVQHQFPGVYWARRAEWDGLRAAMEGSSFYKLPAVLRWFTGSIGYHHVHHFGPRIPNYRLKECYEAIPGLQAKPPLTLMRSFAAIRLKVWDETRRALIGFP